jgi:hypothetical protein
MTMDAAPIYDPSRSCRGCLVQQCVRCDRALLRLKMAIIDHADDARWAMMRGGQAN